jgi:hypothetical protein
LLKFDFQFLIDLFQALVMVIQCIKFVNKFLVVF